ncbi:kinetochore scaffold 1 [Dryobates pubescens]|uniref:kinetochore scaffold 1 n=1 Tax=Dryobates pubescens TaxID=118200 RepID=UPI0023B907B8|nr:kinetochore scaffold 1 [Dryobates pubescens]
MSYGVARGPPCCTAAAAQRRASVVTTAVWRQAQARRLGLNSGAAAALPRRSGGALGERGAPPAAAGLRAEFGAGGESGCGWVSAGIGRVGGAREGPEATAVACRWGGSCAATSREGRRAFPQSCNNTEHVRRKQLSSILKAPRNPLDDLGNGNELTQGVSTEKRSRTSRRVSFANTINCRVFERDLKNNTEGGTGGAADAENDVLPHQSEEPGAASCEITGMNTLLHAPIQALVQQTEAQDGDSSIHRANRQDTTLLLPEDSTMDMTACHTAVIAQDLGSSQAEQPEMDITSLPPGGDRKEAKAEARARVRFSDLPTLSCPDDGQQEDATAVKKISFTEFFMSFKSKRTLRSAEGPQSTFFPPSQASEDAAQSSREFVCSHEQLDNCDVTRVFGEQDDGMEVTKCQASAIRAVFPAPCEAPAQQLPCAEVTSVFADNEMDMTSSHTVKVSFPFTVGNQNLNFPKDSPPPEAGNSMFKRASNQHLTAQHEQLCADRKVANAEDRQDPAALQAARQEARGMAAIPGSISSETVFRGGPPPVCEDMKITGDYTGVISADPSGSRRQTSEQPASRCPAHGDRAAPGSQTASDSPAPGPCKPLELSSGSDGRLERVTQGHSTAPGNAWLDSRRSSVSAGAPQSRLQPRLSSCLVSLPTEKTLILSEDTDLTKTSAVRGDGRDAENESPVGVLTSVTCKPQFIADRATSPSLNEQEEMEMIKCHVVSDEQCNRVTTGGKEMHCEIIPRKNQNKTVSEGASPLDVDKENVEVLGVDGSLRRSQAVEIRAKGLEVMKADKLWRTNFQASGPSSSAKSVCSLQEQRREVPENAVTSTSGSVSLQSQKVMSQPLGRSLLEASVSKGTMSGFKALPCAGEKATTFSADADMDITRSHPVPADYRRVLQHRSADEDSPLPSGDQTCVFTYSDDMEMTALSAVDEPMEKAVPQGMLTLARRTRRKSLKKAAGEETVCFSLDDENNDMDITQSHTAAIGHEILSQNKGGLCSVSSAGAVNPILFPGSQACSGAPSTSHLCADNPSLAQEAGQQARPSSEATVLAVDSKEITTALNLTVEENALPSAQPLTSSTIVFQSFQADMRMTQSHSLGQSIRRAFCQDRAQLAKQEAVPGSRTIIFSSAEDMEITRTHTGVLRGSVGVQVRESTPATSAVPADKTLVFAHNQDDMEITTSHTTAVSNIPASENQPASHQRTQQPDWHHGVWGSCRDKRDSSHKDPDGEYHPDSKLEPSTPASSASAFPAEKGAAQVPRGTTADSVCSASLPEEAVVVQAPQDPPPPVDNPAPGSSQQDLIPQESLKSKELSFRLPGNKPVDHSEESGDLVSRIAPPLQQPQPLVASPDACSTQGNQVLKGYLSQHEDLAADSGMAGGPASNKESQEDEGLSAGGEAPPEDVCISLEHTKQLLVSDSSRDPTEPTLAPELSGILNICSKLESIRRKSTVLSVSETALADQLPKPSVQPEDTLRLGKNLVKEPNHLLCTGEQEERCREPGAAPRDASTGMAPQDQYQGVKVSLGIFQPKLPNRRASVSSVQDTNAKSSADKGEAAAASDTCVRSSESPGKPGRQNFSPSRFVAEEFLPVYLEEMDPNESVSCELMESACSERSKNPVPHNEKSPFEKTKTCSKPKRALEQDEEDLQSPKKVKSDENLHAEASSDLQVTSGAVSQSQAEVHKGEDPPTLSAQSLDCTHASTSSSLDSVKADAELTIQRSSQVESQLLICEDNLREKFQSGLITVGEFLTLLQVHIPIQRPRHSHIPSSGAVSAPPTPEDLLYCQYILRPRLHVYEEDCQALAQKIEELKLHVSVQDQLLVNFNRTLWEVMRTCSDEELKKFGAELNQMKSYFTKESKILAHKEKAELYSKLLQCVQEQQGKIQSRAEELEKLLKEAESCLGAPGADSAWEEWEAECSDEMPGVSCLERELESIKSQEEELQRELSDLEAENEQMLVRMEQLKEEEKHYRELLEHSEPTEWDLIEWNEQQGVFSFLYDSIELTVVFEPPRDGDEFGTDPSRKILSLGFESLLDEAAAPPSSHLVHRLIFQFIASQGCWQEKSPTLDHLPQGLRELSSVVSNCRILGDEVEFLERWGGKFKLLKTDISDTNLTLVFSSAAAFAKFQLTLSLSASYPNAPLPFTVQKLIGNVGEEEVSAVLSTVPVGLNYLRRIVSSLHQDLLQGPS